MAKSELSRPFQLAELGDRPNLQVARLAIRTDVDERAGLARRFDLLSVDEFVATVAVRLDNPGKLVVNGHLRAAVVQRCVVTLDPVPATIDEEFEVVLAKDEEAAGEEEAELDLPEPWPGAELDLGELVAQQLGIALDPYPRAPGADVVLGGDQDQGAETGSHRPFSGLAELRDRLGRKG